jgi:hypothetical protein
MAFSAFAEARTSSRTLICGMANRSPPHSTTSAETIARFNGILMVNVEPWPSTDLSSMVPPIFSMFVRTTSIPTPRPETLVTFSAVENPALKINCWICWSLIPSSSLSVDRPLSRVFIRMRSMFRPRPSSAISMMMWPPS